MKDQSKAAILCCDHQGTQCTGLVLVNGKRVCRKYKKYEIAVKKCAQIGMRLCHTSELKMNICCNSTGCDFKDRLVWQYPLESMYI